MKRARVSSSPVSSGDELLLQTPRQRKRRMVYKVREEDHEYAGTNTSVECGNGGKNAPSFEDNNTDNSVLPKLQTSNLADTSPNLNGNDDIDWDQYEFDETRDVDWWNVFD